MKSLRSHHHCALFPLRRPKKFPGIFLLVLGGMVAISLPASERPVSGASAPITSDPLTPIVEAPPDRDPFALPAQNIADILNSTSIPPTQPVHIAGLVEKKVDELLFVVRDKTGSILVQTAKPGELVPRQVIEAVGFRTQREAAAVLTDVTIRRVGNIDLTIPASSESPPPAPITTVREIRMLTPAEAALGRPVRIQGVVTYYDPDESVAFVQDATAGIYIENTALRVDIMYGQKVEVEGVTQPGGFAPVIANPVFHILGRAPLPALGSYSPQNLFSGNQDSQWIEMRGVMRSAELVGTHLEMDVEIDRGKHVVVTIPQSANLPPPTQFIGARVSLRGVSGTVFNQKRQFVGLRLFMPELGLIALEQSAAADPFSLPIRPINSLLHFSVTEGTESRVRVQGIVTYTRSGAFFFVQDESGGLLVKADHKDRREVGDRMDVVGFPEAGGYTPILAQAVFRKTGVGRPPVPLAKDDAEVTDMIFRVQQDTSDAKLIRLRGRLVEQTASLNDRMLVLQQGAMVFTAHLAEVRAVESWSSLQTGSLLEITGVCSIQVDANSNAVSFRIYLRSPADVAVLERPPWWTVRHMLRVLVAILGIAVLAFGWIFALRRRVGIQTQLIQQRLEREQALEARYRELFASNPHPMWVLDLETLRFLEVNAAAVSHYGHSREEFRGMTLKDICPVNGTDGLVKNLPAQHGGEIVKGIRATHRKKNGALIEVEFSSHQLSFADRRANLILINDITDRLKADAELEQVHKQLHTASRQAGMAEVATGVLHNVGNVLNSVNVSATLIADRLRHSKAVNVTKLAALFDQHKADLAEFLARDARGRMIPEYLGTLAESLTTEHNAMLEEFEHLRKNVEHIKDIVAMQQAYARTSGVIETIAVLDMVEDALRINAGSLDRHRVDTLRDYQTRPVVTTDKYKVVQILINLVRNAKDACKESGLTDRRITVRTTANGHSIKIAIIDNGIGIPAENLTRIFNHGFTTRKEGHGFGLHSGALAAREIGGSLNAQSDGPGLGATFILELPYKLDTPVPSPAFIP